jgi:hypothetical protein
MTGQHNSITLSFMIAGQFSCDRHFGLIKKKYARSKVDTISGLAWIVSESSRGFNIPQLVRNDEGVLEVNTYNWVDFFAPYFKPIYSSDPEVSCISVLCQQCWYSVC